MLGAVPAANALKPAHVPDWVKQAAAARPPLLRPHDAAAILLDQSEITVDAGGRALVHERKVIRLLTAAGRGYSSYPLYYEQASKVHYLHSWTLGADEREYQLDDKDVLDVSAVPDFAVFSSERVRVAQAVAAEPGAVVAFEDEYQEAPYLTAWVYGLDGAVPTLGHTISLALAPGFTYRDGWAHTDAVKPEQTGPSSWRWQTGPRASLDDEPASPELGEVSARMMLAYSGGPVAPADGSWSTVGTWYAELARGRDAPSPAIAAKVAELTAGKEGFYEKVLAITGFMQDEIRYVAVEMGIGGWQPHPAADVFRNRYGDCKDKATLLTVMLAGAGIAAYPVMVDFDHRIDPGMPSHSANHMITAIEVPAEVHENALQAMVEQGGRRLLIFDPTNSVSPAGSLEPELQGTYGLLLAGGASTPIRLPVLPPAANTLERSGSFALALDGSLAGDLVERRAGNTADVLRHLELRGDTRKLEEREEHTLRDSVSNFTLSSLTTTHARERSAPLEVRFHLSANNYAKHAGALLLVRPSVMGGYLAGGMENGRPRLYPVALGEEQDVREEYTIKLPPGYQVEDLPDPVSLQSAFATFTSKVTLEDGSLHCRRELAIRQMEVPAEAFNDYREFFSKVFAAERDEALLKTAP